MKLSTNWTIVSALGVGAFLASAAVPSSGPSAPATAAPAAALAAPPVAVIHDNDAPAGQLVDGVLNVRLRAVETDWRPLGDDQPGAVVYAFSEGDGPPMIPSPLLRTELGTQVRVTFENTLGATLIVQGLTARVASLPEPVAVPPGETRVVTFTADAEGTYPYWGRVVADPDLVSLDIRDRDGLDAPLSGVFVVDAPGGGPAEHEDILLIGLYRHGYATGDSAVLQTINGRPWPRTKRLQYTQGDTVRWRLVNSANRGHPMHLHGFFYEIDSKGDLARDTLYWASQKRLAVTEDMEAGSTMSLSWSPDRPGGWLFHCHISAHVVPNPPLGDVARDVEDVRRRLLLGDPHHDPDHHVEQGMGGLMMAVDVAPAPGWRPDERERRQIRALIVSDSTPAPTGAAAGAPDGASGLAAAFQNRSPYRRRFALIVQDPEAPRERTDVPFPGEALILRAGEPTTIWVVNRASEPSAIHWHGVELESLYDGVVGVGGYVGSRTPPVLPGDSFQVRVTPPRAGSFMYHTHMSDIRQQGGGLYGPFIVLGEDERWDPESDRVYLMGNGPAEGGVYFNGQKTLPATEMVAGRTYRLRFMNITLVNSGARVRVVRDGYPARWTPVAKDGADLPERWRLERVAETPIRVGETMDFAFVPEPGEYTVEARSSGGALFASQRIRVRGGAAGGPGR